MQDALCCVQITSLDDEYNSARLSLVGLERLCSIPWMITPTIRYMQHKVLTVQALRVSDIKLAFRPGLPVLGMY